VVATPTITNTQFAFSGDTSFTHQNVLTANAGTSSAEGIVIINNGSTNSVPSGATYYVQGVETSTLYQANPLVDADGHDILVSGGGAGTSGSYVAATNTALYRVTDHGTTENPNVYGYIYQPANSTTPTYNSSINSNSSDLLNTQLNSDSDNMGNLVTILASQSVAGDANARVVGSVDGTISAFDQQSATTGVIFEFVSQDTVVVDFSNTGFGFLLSGNGEGVYMPAP
jgi:hypothetical protein